MLNRLGCWRILVCGLLGCNLSDGFVAPWSSSRLPVGVSRIPTPSIVTTTTTASIRLGAKQQKRKSSATSDKESSKAKVTIDKKKPDDLVKGKEKSSKDKADDAKKSATDTMAQTNTKKFPKASAVDDDDSDSSSAQKFSVVPPKENKRTDLGIAADADGVVVDDQQLKEDTVYMKMALDLAQQAGGERGERSAYPNPTVGAVLVSFDGTILGKGRSDYRTEAVHACLEDSGLNITPLTEWTIGWSEPELREAIASSTLYVTLEPSTRRRGTATPPVTCLIRQSGIPRVVIGCPSPVPEKAFRGAKALHDAGVAVSVATTLEDECQSVITDFAESATCKLQCQARKHFQLFGRPLGFMHCSVVDSDNVEAFARQGNAFGTNFGGNNLSFRNFGSYELAPPPDIIWAADDEEDEDSGFYSLDFEDEDNQGTADGSPMMPWYEQVDAVVATFPRKGNGPPDDNSVTARLNGLRWLATHGTALPAGVERILVMDATELIDLPLTNSDPNLPKGVDVEAFWAGKHRKRTRVLLRRGVHEAARVAAAAAAASAQAAATAAEAAANAVESGDATRAAEAALECQKAARASQAIVQKELERTQVLRRRLEDTGVTVETLEGGEPIDIMRHLGERNGMYSVVWRAGCWGNRGVKAIMDGAFQWVSGHMAVDAVGGRFWQLMLAENALQAACGPASKVKVFSEVKDISLEYCDEPDADTDCILTIDGRPVRHVRLDARVALVNENRAREFSVAKTQEINRKQLVERAPWFL